MDDEKYNRLVTLLCPTCSNSLFEAQDNDPQNESIRCLFVVGQWTKNILFEKMQKISTPILMKRNKKLLMILEKNSVRCLEKISEDQKY